MKDLLVSVEDQESSARPFQPLLSLLFPHGGGTCKLYQICIHLVLNSTARYIMLQDTQEKNIIAMKNLIPTSYLRFYTMQYHLQCASAYGMSSITYYSDQKKQICNKVVQNRKNEQLEEYTQLQLMDKARKLLKATVATTDWRLGQPENKLVFQIGMHVQRDGILSTHLI